MKANDPINPILNVDFDIKNQDVAFEHNAGNFNVNYKGIDLRTHLAAMAMQGILANCGMDYPSDYVTARSVVYADALIEELNKPK